MEKSGQHEHLILQQIEVTVKIRKGQVRILDTFLLFDRLIFSVWFFSFFYFFSKVKTDVGQLEIEATTKSLMFCLVVLTATPAGDGWNRQILN